MLTIDQISSIRKRLEDSQNPLFLFDNDTDGLCAFLLLRRHIGRGKGFPIKSFPELNVSYERRLEELNPDVLFILDKPLVSPDFFEIAKRRNIPVIWIDHHDVNPFIPEGVEYFNPLKTNHPSSEPTSYQAWLVTKNKNDMWLAMVGCLADSYLPDFSQDLVAQYPDLWRNVESSFEGRYSTQLGRLTMFFSFGLKDRTTNVINMMRFLSNVKSPNELFQESQHNSVLDRYAFINRKYQLLLAKAKSTPPEGDNGEILYFQYGGDLSISADLADELFFNFPNKTIITCFISGAKANLSLRSKKDILAPATNAINEVAGATGGGHKNAVGASMPSEDVLRFKEKFKENLREK